MSQGRTFAFRHLAEANFGKPRARNLNMVTGASWQDALALFRMNGQREYLDRAVQGALAYIATRIATPQTNFDDVHAELGGQFWSDFAAKWTDLIELYEETKDDRSSRRGGLPRPITHRFAVSRDPRGARESRRRGWPLCVPVPPVRQSEENGRARAGCPGLAHGVEWTAA